MDGTLLERVGKIMFYEVNNSLINKVWAYLKDTPIARFFKEAFPLGVYLVVVTVLSPLLIIVQLFVNESLLEFFCRACGVRKYYEDSAVSLYFTSVFIIGVVVILVTLLF